MNLEFGTNYSEKTNTTNPFSLQPCGVLSSIKKKNEQKKVSEEEKNLCCEASAIVSSLKKSENRKKTKASSPKKDGQNSKKKKGLKISLGGGRGDGGPKIKSYGPKSKRGVSRVYETQISHGRIQKKNRGSKVSKKSKDFYRGKKQMGIIGTRKAPLFAGERSLCRGFLRGLDSTKKGLQGRGKSTDASPIHDYSASMNTTMNTTSLLSTIDKGFGALSGLIKAFDSLSTMN